MAIISWNNLATKPGASIAPFVGTIHGLTPVAPIEGALDDLIQPTLDARVYWRATAANQCAAFTVRVDAADVAIGGEPAFVAGLLDVVQPFNRPTDSAGFNFRAQTDPGGGATMFDSVFNPAWGRIINESTVLPRGLQSYLHNIWFTASPPFSPGLSITFVAPLDRTLGGQFFSGDVSIGGVWIGAGFEFDGVDSSWQVGVDDASRIAESEGRQAYASGGSIVDTMQCSISVQDQEKSLMALGQPYNFRRWIREVGISRPTVILPRTSDEASMVELGIHGLIQGRAPRITHQGEGWHRVEPFSIRSLR